MENILIPKIGDTLYTVSSFIEGGEGKVYAVDFDEECKVYRVAVMWHYDNACSPEYDASNYTDIDYGTYAVENGIRRVKSNKETWYYDKILVSEKKRKNLQSSVDGLESLVATLEQRLSTLGKEPAQLCEGNPVYGYYDEIERSASIREYRGEVIKVSGKSDYKEVIFTYGNEHSKHAEIGMKCPWHSHIILDTYHFRFFLSERDMLEACIEKCKEQLVVNRQLQGKLK